LAEVVATVSKGKQSVAVEAIKMAHTMVTANVCCGKWMLLSVWGSAWWRSKHYQPL